MTVTPETPIASLAVTRTVTGSGSGAPITPAWAPPETALIAVAGSVTETSGESASVRRSTLLSVTPLHRVYLERLEALMDPPAPPTAAAQGGGPAGPPPLNVRRTDLGALARAQVRSIESLARTTAGTATGATTRAHWWDLADRAAAILDPSR